jgi:small-conductance mechanosensitive channel
VKRCVDTAIRADLLRIVKLSFDREGISIPYPHQVQVDYATGRDAAPAKDTGAP